MSTYLRVTSDLNADKSVVFSKFGIKGDGKAFDDRGVSTLVGAAEDSGTVHLGGNPQMLLGSTLTLSNRAGLRLTTDREPNTERREAAPAFLWGGVAGGDMLLLDRCRRVTLDGFVFETDDFFRQRAPAGRAIVLDGGQDTGPGPAIGTSCTLKRLRHVTYPGALDVEATFITIAQTTKLNQEFHHIIECGGNGNGRGTFLRQGPSYNAKNTRLEESRYIDGYQKAVVVENGSLKMRHNNMSLNEWDLWLAASTGYVVEEHHIGEGSAHHAFIDCPFVSRDGTYDNAKTRPQSVAIAGLPSYYDDPAGLTHPEAWMMFGANYSDALVERATIGSPPSPDSRFFGWMGDRCSGRTEIGPNWLAFGHSRATLGIDDATLGAIKGRPEIIFRNRVGDGNPNGPGIVDLPGGQLHLCDGAVHV